MTRLDLIHELLRHEDIEGLLSMGAPDDEYESEAEMIADRIGAAEERGTNKITKEEVERVVASVWKEMLGSPTRSYATDASLLRRSQPGSLRDAGLP